MKTSRLATAIALCWPALLAAQNTSRTSFINAKTWFQTNSNYDPRIALAVDAVVVHMSHAGVRWPGLRDQIAGWHDRGYTVGRMFFSDSDASNEYWTGKFDGTPHPEDVEKDAGGKTVLCAGVRPYMLPTPGWTKYLEEMVKHSIACGADAILPEEPLAHVHTGYEKEFAKLWEQEYKQPWLPENKSPEARFMTAELKRHLYGRLEARLAEVTREEALKAGRQIPFLLPVHTIYSNVASHLTAPLGESTNMPGVDGFVGQVWTGPINWSNANYGSENKSFFASAYALYDYFAELAVRGNRKLWMLVDPVEDDPNHTWPEFEQWYKHSTVASMMFPGINLFEVMPWPDRIFLPGYSMGGGTPAPERFRVITLSIVQAMQDLPSEGKWVAPAKDGVTEGVGVAVSDSLMSRHVKMPMLQDPFSLLIPLAQAGVPVSSCVMERVRESQYLSRFRVIVVADAVYRPPSPDLNTALAQWVKRGGCLVLVGEPEPLDVPMWWTRMGLKSPMEHLIAQLGSAPGTAESEEPVGRGYILRLPKPASSFADPETSRRVYLPLIARALQRAGVAGGLQQPGTFCLRRGAYVVTHAATQPLQMKGSFIDVLDPQLPLVTQVSLKPGESGLYRDVATTIAAAQRNPRSSSVLHTTHRLMHDRWTREGGEILIRGPKETPGLVRLTCPEGKSAEAAGTSADGQPVKVDITTEGTTALLKFPNEPPGVVLRVKWVSSH